MLNRCEQRFSCYLEKHFIIQACFFNFLYKNSESLFPFFEKVDEEIKYEFSALKNENKLIDLNFQTKIVKNNIDNEDGIDSLRNSFFHKKSYQDSIDKEIS